MPINSTSLFLASIGYVFLWGSSVALFFNSDSSMTLTLGMLFVIGSFFLLLLGGLLLSFLILQRVRTQHLSLKHLMENIHKENLAHRKKLVEKLQNYAYANAHEVRGPLARILGLVYLIEINGMDLQSADLIKKSALELDDIIKKISTDLEKEMESKLHGVIGRDC